jgi:hypothetical protein
MPKSWFNNGYKYIKHLKKKKIILVFQKLYTQIIEPDKGSEFKGNTFQKLLDKHNIKTMLVLGHAPKPFVESVNKQ